MKLFIKNMVSAECKDIVKQEMENLGLQQVVVELGEAEIKEPLSAAKLDELKIALEKSGLELINDRKSMLTEKIKNVILELVYHSDEPLKINFSYYLSQRLHYDYTYLSNLFSEVKGITIEHFLIANKIEKVKELLIYNELNLTEISYKLNYSSVAHLSKQFKKVTGLTPSHFKNLRKKQLKGLENI